MFSRQADGSPPEPMWTWTCEIFTPASRATVVTRSSPAWCTPKLEYLSPVLRVTLSPAPTPGFTRTDTVRPWAFANGTIRSSCLKEQAL